MALEEARRDSRLSARERVSTRKQQTGRKRGRDSARELRRERERERERERRTNEVSRSQIGRSDVASLASRIYCTLCRKPPTQTLFITFDPVTDSLIFKYGLRQIKWAASQLIPSNLV